ncbi:Protein tpx2, partial [Modicella reniformis]
MVFLSWLQPAKRQLTMPSSPVLRTRTRVHKAAATTTLKTTRVLQDISQHVGYKANKINRRIFESSGDLGVPKITKRPLTVPKSPAFSKREHLQVYPAATLTKISEPPSDQKQRLNNIKQSHPVVTQQGLVSCAESARRLSADKAKHADPQDNASEQKQCARSQTPKPAVTVPIPFKFETDIRRERYQEQFQQKLEKWKQIEKDHHFKALPLPVYPEMVPPKKSTKPLTHPESFHFWTDDRAQQREVFEQERRRKGQMIQEMMAEKAREDELRVQQEIREIRKHLVPHPTSIRHYPPIEIHKSSRPLTVPQSPNIGEKRKRQMM